MTPAIGELAIGERAVKALGFIGLGVMGEPMCANLIARSGRPVYGTDRAPAPVASLAERGMVPCGTAAEVGRQTDIVFVCVASGDQLREVCFGPDGLIGDSPEARSPQARVIIDCSTTSVALTRDFAERCGRLGVAWIDAPIARGREAAHSGTLSIMVGADPVLFGAVEPLLRCIGSDVTRCGGTGCGQVVKILNNKVMIQTVHALAEALVVAEAAGVDGTLLFEVLSGSSADSQALRYQGFNALLPRRFPRSAFPATYARKDIGLAIELAETAGLEAALAETTAELLDRAIATGHSQDYYPVILKVLERLRGGD